MIKPIKDYHFTDEQIDHILRLVRDRAFQQKYNNTPLSGMFAGRYDYNELANIIEDQIVNHPSNL